MNIFDLIQLPVVSEDYSTFDFIFILWNMIWNAFHKILPYLYIDVFDIFDSVINSTANLLINVIFDMVGFNVPSWLVINFNSPFSFQLLEVLSLKGIVILATFGVAWWLLRKLIEFIGSVWDLIPFA